MNRGFLRRVALISVALLVCNLALALTVCSKCGHEVADGAEKCGHCNALVIKPKTAPPPAPEEKTEDAADATFAVQAEEFVKEQYQRAQANLDEHPGVAFAYYQNAFAALRLVPADERSKRIGQKIMADMGVARKAMNLGRVPCRGCKGTGKYKVDLGKVDGSKNVRFVEGINCRMCNGKGWKIAHLSVERIKMSVLQGRQTFEQQCMVAGYHRMGRAFVNEALFNALSLRQRVLVMTGIPAPCKDCQYTGLEVCRGCKGSGWEQCPAAHCKDGVIETSSSRERGQMKKKRLNAEGQKKCGMCQGWGEIPCRMCQGTGCRICAKCGGTGEAPRCKRCSGGGLVSCTRCNGTGKYKDGECSKCSGEGDLICPTCGGEGSVSR